MTRSLQLAVAAAVLGLATLACNTLLPPEVSPVAEEPPIQATAYPTDTVDESASYVNKNGTSLGNPAAPVIITEFLDFQCPHCLNSYTELEKLLIERYVNTGEVYLTLQPLGFLGPDSVSAAQAAYCAASQNLFWEFHDLIFANFSAGNSEGYSAENLTQLVGQLSEMDDDLFATCMAGDEALSQLQQAHDDAESLGVTGVPGFVVNGRLLMGEQSFAAMSSAIQDALGN